MVDHKLKTLILAYIQASASDGCISNKTRQKGRLLLPVPRLSHSSWKQASWLGSQPSVHCLAQHMNDT